MGTFNLKQLVVSSQTHGNGSGQFFLGIGSYQSQSGQEMIYSCYVERYGIIYPLNIPARFVTIIESNEHLHLYVFLNTKSMNMALSSGNVQITDINNFVSQYFSSDSYAKSLCNAEFRFYIPKNSIINTIDLNLKTR
ncbi:MAG TPA: hypothetical protein VI815_02525 [Candidatus Nanoarchaeia archaeon]|nr:hypothetical protein [Candidatus Nanoarchaeia archaeon]